MNIVYKKSIVPRNISKAFTPPRISNKRITLLRRIDGRILEVSEDLVFNDYKKRPDDDQDPKKNNDEIFFVMGTCLVLISFAHTLAI